MCMLSLTHGTGKSCMVRFGSGTLLPTASSNTLPITACIRTPEISYFSKTREPTDSQDAFIEHITCSRSPLGEVVVDAFISIVVLDTKKRQWESVSDRFQ